MRLIVYVSIHNRGPFVWKDIVSKPQFVVHVLGKVEYQISVRLTFRDQICFEEAATVLGICLTCQVEELVLVPDVFQEYKLFSV